MYKIERKFHFHAAHRNTAIQDKCRNLHGHTYHVVVSLRMKEPDESGVTTLFDDICKLIEPIIKEMDHTTLLKSNDPLKFFLLNLNHAYPEQATTFKEFPFETSAENLAKYIFDEVVKTGLDPISVSLQETTSSTVIYEL
jgi:6-pyruvoyltetrahydropterin/6-carboxytetrahydropterin synthase